MLHTDVGWVRFQSTHPVRGATKLLLFLSGHFAFQSTHPVRGATAMAADTGAALLISIHAPREGCDYTADKQLTVLYYSHFKTATISTHDP